MKIRNIAKFGHKVTPSEANYIYELMFDFFIAKSGGEIEATIEELAEFERINPRKDLMIAEKVVRIAVAGASYARPRRYP